MANNNLSYYKKEKISYPTEDEINANENLKQSEYYIQFKKYVNEFNDAYEKIPKNIQDFYEENPELFVTPIGHDPYGDLQRFKSIHKKYSKISDPKLMKYYMPLLEVVLDEIACANKYISCCVIPE